MADDDVAAVVIVGAGGHARVVAEAMLPEKVVGHVSSAGDGGSAGPDLGPLLGDDDAIQRLGATGHAFAIGVGFVDAAGSARRAHLLEELTAVELVTVCHSDAIVSPSARLGAGTFVGPGAVVGTGVELGRGAIVNSGAIVDHDCLIGDNVHIAPGAVLSGGVSVGDHTLVGVGVSVRQGVSIGSKVLVGAGAAVVSDLPNGVTAIGVPARSIAPTS